MKEGKERVLIIKTGYSEILHLDTKNHTKDVSFGDILRTTPILHLYKDDDVTWVTDEKAFPLLEENPFINRLLPFDWITAEQLKKERFDILINLEKTPGICIISDDIYAKKRYGFTFDPEKRKAQAYEEAAEILSLSSNYEIKKINQKTSQELLFEMVGKKWNGEEYVLGYKPKTYEIYDIALNTLVGKKFPTKTWPQKYWDELEEILKRDGFRVTRQDKYDEKILGNLYEYIDWINSHRLIVTVDTLGMHLGIALNKKVLTMFGPTPYKEIHFYKRGKIILPKTIPNCMPCFKQKCIRERSCMEEISPGTVYDEVVSMMKT